MDLLLSVGHLNYFLLALRLENDRAIWISPLLQDFIVLWIGYAHQTIGEIYLNFAVLKTVLCLPTERIRAGKSKLWKAVIKKSSTHLGNSKISRPSRKLVCHVFVSA